MQHSYESLAKTDHEDEDDDIAGVEMSNKSPKLLAPPSLSAQKSSAHIITAFEELSFQQHQSQKKIKNRLKKKTINKKEAKGELKQAYKTLAHTLDRETLAITYKTDLKNGLNSTQVNEQINDPNIGYNELTPPPRSVYFNTYLSTYKINTSTQK